MITLNPIYLLIALPAWLATVYFLRQMRKVRQATKQLVPVRVDSEK